uniref:serine hydrolase domain-containing protein n=1 Tax=Flavobacterium sp. TaxID=239 RepID=UPI00404A4075
MKTTVVVFLAMILGMNSFGQSITNKALANNIDNLFESYAYYNRFMGSVLISKDNQIIYQKSFGFADLENREKNTDKSVFSIASLSKSLTAVGIMKLVEEEKLTLETTIEVYFPEFMPDFSKSITIQNLLNHSSGMEANIGRTDDNGNGLMPEITAISLEALLVKFKDSKLIFEPGTGYDYNNFGYLLLANIIEKVSGQSYEDFMKQKVFKPLGMKNTYIESFDSLNDVAQPYLGLGLHNYTKLDASFHVSWLKGAGDISSTTVDLYKFMQALENGTLIKPATVNKIYTHSQSVGVNEMASGFGWVIDRKDHEKWIYNTGLLPGFASAMGSLSDKNIKIIILSNATTINPASDDFQGEVTFVPEITDKIIALCQGKSVQFLPIPIPNSDAGSIIDKTKTYQLDHEHTVLLKKIGKHYFLQTAGTAPWSIFTYSFSKDANENNASCETALFFAKAMSTQNFDGLTDYANDEMKGFLGTNEGLAQLKGMWANFLQNAGQFISYNIYKVEGEAFKNVHIRFHFETIDIGIVLSINADHKIQGMFMDDAVNTSHVQTVKLIPISENEFFINGYEYNGMQDLKITVSNSGLILTDGSVNFAAKSIQNQQ